MCLLCLLCCCFVVGQRQTTKLGIRDVMSDFWPEWSIKDIIAWIEVNAENDGVKGDVPSKWKECIKTVLSKHPIFLHNKHVKFVNKEDVFSIPSILKEKFCKEHDIDNAGASNSNISGISNDTYLIQSIKKAIEMLQQTTILEKNSDRTVATEKKQDN